MHRVLVLLLFATTLFAKDIPREMNGFKLGDSQEQIASHAKEIVAKDNFSFGTNTDYLTYEGGIFSTYSPAAWSFFFYENQCYRIFCCFNSFFDDYKDIKALLTEKYGKPKACIDNEEITGLHGFKWIIKDKESYIIKLLDNPAKEKFYLIYINTTMEMKADKAEKDAEKSNF